MAAFIQTSFTALNVGFAVHGVLAGSAPWVVAVSAAAAVFCGLSMLVWERR